MQDGLQFSFDCRTTFTVVRLFSRDLSIPLGYVAVADYFEFGETGTVVGEMKNHAASRRDKTDMVLGYLKTA